MSPESRQAFHIVAVSTHPGRLQATWDGVYAAGWFDVKENSMDFLPDETKLQEEVGKQIDRNEPFYSANLVRKKLMVHAKEWIAGDGANRDRSRPYLLLAGDAPQRVAGQTLEKPKNLKDFFRITKYVLPKASSGESTIESAFGAVVIGTDDTIYDPGVSVVSTTYRMVPLDRERRKEFIRTIGWEQIKKIAGGISLHFIDFIDITFPLQAKIRDGETGEIKGEIIYQWDSSGLESGDLHRYLNRFIYGSPELAVEMAIDDALAHFQNAIEYISEKKVIWNGKYQP